MKILLIGEFSGVHNNLKSGLDKIGNEVTIVSNGDGFKQFKSDLLFSPFKPETKHINKVRNVLHFINNLKHYVRFDVVQFINPFCMPNYLNYLKLERIIFKYNKKTVYYACGTDPAFLKSKNKFLYFPYDDTHSINYPVYSEYFLSFFKWFIKHIDIIIPSCYTYYAGYSQNNKLIDPIPLPGSGRYRENIGTLEKKVKILHGITRSDFKGSDLICAALEEIKRDYDDKVEIKIIEKVPFSQYEGLLDWADIVVDQCKSYDYGMNAIFALEKGCIVLSGAEDIAVKYLRMDNNPIINIRPSKENIVEELKKLLLMEINQLRLLKIKGVIFVKKYHDPIAIAKRFEDVYLGN